MLFRSCPLRRIAIWIPPPAMLRSGNDKIWIAGLRLVKARPRWSTLRVNCLGFCLILGSTWEFHSQARAAKSISLAVAPWIINRLLLHFVISACIGFMSGLLWIFLRFLRYYPRFQEWPFLIAESLHEFPNLLKFFIDFCNVVHEISIVLRGAVLAVHRACLFFCIPHL